MDTYEDQSFELGGYIPVENEEDPRSQTRWLSLPMLALSLIVPAAVVVCCRTELIVGALLACLNCIIIGAAAIYLLRQGTVHAFMPMLFLGFFVISWPMPTIYLAIFSPDLYYELLGGQKYSYMQGIEILQLAVLVFIVGFLVVIIPMVKRKKYQESFRTMIDPVLAGRMAALSLVIGFVAIAANMVSKVITLPGPLTYVCNGAFNYSFGLFLVAGAFYRYVSRGVLLFTFLFLGCAAFFYIAGNARTLAFYPIFSLAVGMLFFSDMPQRRKAIMLAIVVFVFPVVLVAANTTREVLGSIGFRDMGRRIEALGNFDEVLARGKTGTRSMERLFIQGSHAVVTMTPESIPYEDFSFSTFMQSLAMKMFVPGVFYEGDDSSVANAYTFRDIMPRYGFLITEETSVPTGIVGSFWVFGGWLPLMIGALATGLIIGLGCRFVGWMERKTALMAIFVMTLMLPVLFQGPTMDIVSLLRGLCWRAVLGVILYFIVMSAFVGGKKQLPSVAATDQGE